MRYYKHNIGDFLADTHYLSNPRLAVYIKLVWEYYLQEKPIKLIGTLTDKAEELKTNEDTLEYILDRYFYEVRENNVWLWRHKRIDSELAKMNSTNQKKSEGAQSRWNNDTTINGFDKFWEAYPNKKDKQKAIKAWAKHQPDIVNVLKAIVVQKNSEQWKKDNGRFIPLPTTWLNGARWEDEVDGKPKAVDRNAISNELAKKDQRFWYLSKEEQSELINLYIKENA
jgi:uncharacterized protein YdaU (DUF1376 family)